MFDGIPPTIPDQTVADGPPFLHSEHTRPIPSDAGARHLAIGRRGGGLGSGGGGDLLSLAAEGGEAVEQRVDARRHVAETRYHIGAVCVVI